MDELRIDAAVRQYCRQHDIDLKSKSGKVEKEDIVFLLSQGDPSRFKGVLKLTRGEALHWMLMMAKSTPKKKKNG